MEEIILRGIKSIVLGIICFISLKMLGFPYDVSGLIACVPIILGTLNIFASFAYSIAALCFIGSVGWYVIGDDNRALLASVWDSARKEIVDTNAKAELVAPTRNEN